MKFPQYLLSVSMICLLLVTAANAQDANLVLRNGVVWTVDENNPRAEAIAARDDRISYVGADAAV